MREGDRRAVETFENAMMDIPQVVQAQRLFGDPDYLLHVIARDRPLSNSFTTRNSPLCRACSA